jgi:hypothetical protein
MTKSKNSVKGILVLFVVASLFSLGFVKLSYDATALDERSQAGEEVIGQVGEEAGEEEVYSSLSAADDDLLIGTFFKNNADTSDFVYVSQDGINFNYISTALKDSDPSGDPNMGDEKESTGKRTYRDPSIMYRAGYFYIISGMQRANASGKTASPCFKIASSSNLKNWSNEGKVCTSVKVSDAPDLGSDKLLDALAPEWFQDTDGKLYINFTAGNYYKGALGKGIDLQDGRRTRQFMTQVTSLKGAGAGKVPTASTSAAFKLNGGRLSSVDNRDGHIFKENGTYYMTLKFGTPKPGSLEYTMEVWRSTSLKGQWSLYDSDAYNNPPLTDAYRLFEGPSVVKFRGKYFVYADNYINTVGGRPYGGGRVNYSVGDTLHALTTPKPIVTSNGFNARHGTVLRVTDPNAKKIVWAALGSSAKSRTNGNYNFSTKKPPTPAAVWYGSRFFDDSKTCDFRHGAYQNDGRILSVCILPSKDDLGAPILAYEVSLTSSFGDRINYNVYSPDAKRFSIYNLPATAQGREWTLSIRSRNKNGFSAWKKYGTFWTSTASPSDGKPFVDVGRENIHVDSVGWLKDNGITQGSPQGSNTYRPGDPVNRGSMASFLRRVTEINPTTSKNPFVDIGGNIHKDNILWMYANKITTGSPQGSNTYKPQDLVNRGSMATFLYRLAGSPEYTPPAKSPFKDVPTTHLHYKGICWLYANGITTGTGNGNYSPSKAVNRGSMATFIHRMYYLVH